MRTPRLYTTRRACLLACALLGALTGCDPLHLSGAPADLDERPTLQIEASPATLAPSSTGTGGPPAASPAAPSVGLEVIASATRQPFVLPLPDEGARHEEDDVDTAGFWPVDNAALHREVLDVEQTRDGRVIALLRPGDVWIETPDGGRTWHVAHPNVTLSDIEARGRREWWGLGRLGETGQATRVTQSRDRGGAWRIEATRLSLLPEPRHLARHDDLVALAAGEYLVWTEDGGREWRYLDTTLRHELTAVWRAPSSGDWWVGDGRGNLSRHVFSEHRRGDRAWSPEALPVDARVEAFAEAPGGDLFVATRSGLWRRLDAEAWREVAPLAQRDLRGVHFTADGLGLAFGVGGRLAVSVDGGERWRDLTGEVRAALDLAPLDAVGLTWRGAADVEGGGALLFGDGAVVVRVAR